VFLLGCSRFCLWYPYALIWIWISALEYRVEILRASQGVTNLTLLLPIRVSDYNLHARSSGSRDQGYGNIKARHREKRKGVIDPVLLALGALHHVHLSISLAGPSNNLSFVKDPGYPGG